MRVKCFGGKKIYFGWGLIQILLFGYVEWYSGPWWSVNKHVYQNSQMKMVD